VGEDKSEGDELVSVALDGTRPVTPSVAAGEGAAAGVAVEEEDSSPARWPPGGGGGPPPPPVCITVMLAGGLQFTAGVASSPAWKQWKGLCQSPMLAKGGQVRRRRDVGWTCRLLKILRKRNVKDDVGQRDADSSQRPQWRAEKESACHANAMQCRRYRWLCWLSLKYATLDCVCSYMYVVNAGSVSFFSFLCGREGSARLGLTDVEKERDRAY
jgi:hypothetical protein